MFSLIYTKLFTFLYLFFVIKIIDYLHNYFLQHLVLTSSLAFHEMIKFLFVFLSQMNTAKEENSLTSYRGSVLFLKRKYWKILRKKIEIKWNENKLSVTEININ